MKKKEFQTNNYLAIPAFDRLSGIRHAFTTRQNGLGMRNNGSKGPDDWKTIAERFGVGTDRIVTVNQVHGDTIVRVDESNFAQIKRAQADAMITTIAGIPIGVETADCVPILLYDTERRAAAAVHAGWRSTVKTIVQKTVVRMREEFGTNPGSLVAAIGPAIGPECYEVDEPVMGPLREAFPFWGQVSSDRGNDRWSLDLVALNTHELLRVGVPRQSIHALGLCTSCRRDLFYSFRAEGKTGRMLSVIMIKP